MYQVLACKSLELELCVTELGDYRLCGCDCIQHVLLRNLVGSAFDHGDSLAGTGYDDVQVSVLDLLECGVYDILAVDKSHSDTGNRSVERNVGDCDCCAGCVDGDDVGCVDLVRGDDCRDNLDLTAEGLLEQRSHGAVDQTADQDFLVLGLSFPLEESSGDLSGGIVLLVVLD